MAKHVIKENLMENSFRREKAAELKMKLQACIQCGTCTGSCPNEFAMDVTPRHLWRLVLAGYIDDVFKTRTFTLCSDCYCCTLRCPRGLPLTEAMETLKAMAASENLPMHKQTSRFYKSFMDSVRRHGRVKELEMMTQYFMVMKNPMLPLRYASLGSTLFLKKKVRLEAPFVGATRPLEPIFRKVEELEGLN